MPAWGLRRLSPELHLRLLTALCGDALSCAPMRAVINERESSMATLHTERLKEVGIAKCI